MKIRGHRRQRFVLLAFAALLSYNATCGNRAPNQVAGDVAYNATIVVKAIDVTQKFIAEQEAAGRIPRNQAVTAMEAIGRSLKAAEAAGQHLQKLAQLTSNDPLATTTIEQIQQALAVVSSEAAMALVPIGDEATRKQLSALVAEVNKAIGTVNGLILSRGRS